MINRILAGLKALSLEDYLINDKQTSSAELFFVKKELDMRRMKDVEKVSVTVYRTEEAAGGKKLGNSDALLTPDMTDEEIREALADAYASAANAMNPWYELYQGEKAEKITEDKAIASLSTAETALKIAEALFSSDTRDDAFLNSAEIFVEKQEVRILSSTGTDVSYVSYNVNGEFVAQCREPQDVEQHFTFRYDDVETEALKAKVAEALNTVADRARAVKAPAGGNYDVVLSGENLAEILTLYLYRGNAAYVYPGYSNYHEGLNVQGEEISGEKLNMDLLPASPYSDEGIPMKRREFIKDGILSFVHGNDRFCKYLGIEPTGMYRKIALKGGTVPFDEMKKGCLYPVTFSDFQMDPFSGHFAGEMRLAYNYGENGVEILTGGSINGSLLQKQDDLCFSLETYKDASYEGPLAVKIKDVAVAG